MMFPVMLLHSKMSILYLIILYNSFEQVFSDNAQDNACSGWVKFLVLGGCEFSSSPLIGFLSNSKDSHQDEADDQP